MAITPWIWESNFKLLTIYNFLTDFCHNVWHLYHNIDLVTLMWRLTFPWYSMYIMSPFSCQKFTESDIFILNDLFISRSLVNRPILSTPQVTSIASVIKLKGIKWKNCKHLRSFFQLYNPHYTFMNCACVHG